MKRSWDIIREMLTRLEELPDTDSALRLPDFVHDRANEYSYHARLLIEAGLAAGQMSKEIGNGPKDFRLVRLTWDGHEFLDAVRSDTIWRKIKNRFADNGMNMTFELIKSVAAEITVSFIHHGM